MKELRKHKCNDLCKIEVKKSEFYPGAIIKMTKRQIEHATYNPNNPFGR